MSVSQRIYNALPAFVATVSILGVLFGIFAYFVGVEARVSFAWVILAFFVPLPLCAMLVDMLRQAIGESRTRLPRIVRCLATQRAQPSPQLLLIASSPLFGQGMSASIYSMEEGFEILIAEGYVLTVRQDAHIQIAITRFIENTQTIWQQLTANSPDALIRTIVRPGNQWRGE
jgi:hypothetical protein